MSLYIETNLQPALYSWLGTLAHDRVFLVDMKENESSPFFLSALPLRRRRKNSNNQKKKKRNTAKESRDTLQWVADFAARRRF